MNQKSLHIGFLTSEYIIPPKHLDGGLAAYIQKVSRCLVTRGHRVSVVCLSNRNYDWSDEGVHVYEVLDESLKTHELLNNILYPTAELEKIIQNSSKLAKRILEVNLHEPLDIIQASSFRAVGIALCNNGKIPLVTRVSSMAPLFRNADSIGKNVNPLSTALTDWIVIHQMENSDCTFAPSALLAKYYSLFSQATPHVVRSPFDMSNQNPDESFYDQNLIGMKYLLFFGKLNRIKGIEVVSRSVGKLIEEFPDLHFVFIGKNQITENNQHYASKIFQENQKWNKNLHYFTSLPKQKLYPVIRHARAVLVPSLMDNYPNTCLEAMQFGKIIIGTYESSLEEMIIDGETGILVQKNDVASLQAGIRKLLSLSSDQEKEMERMIKMNYEKIISEDRIAQLLDIYYDVIHAYAPLINKDQFNWDRLLLRSKFQNYLRLGFFPGIILRIVQILTFSWKFICRKF